MGDIISRLIKGVAIIFVLPLIYTLGPFPTITLPVDLVNALTSEVVLRFFSIAYIILPIKFIMNCFFLILLIKNWNIAVNITRYIMSYLRGL